MDSAICNSPVASRPAWLAGNFQDHGPFMAARGLPPRISSKAQGQSFEGGLYMLREGPQTCFEMFPRRMYQQQTLGPDLRYAARQELFLLLPGWPLVTTAPPKLQQASTS